MAYDSGMEFSEAFAEQVKRYPLLKAQDALKFAYQSAYGAEHLLSDLGKAQAYLEEEYASVKKDKSLPLFEELGGEGVRVNLGPWKERGYPVFDLFELFVRSAHFSAKADASFVSNCQVITRLVNQNGVPFSFREWKQALAEREVSGGGPVHHSEFFEKTYFPHYRIVKKELLSGYLESLS